MTTSKTPKPYHRDCEREEKGEEEEEERDGEDVQHTTTSNLTP